MFSIHSAILLVLNHREGSYVLSQKIVEIIGLVNPHHQ